MMQKSTIVTHTVDQGNLRVQINKTGKETKEHNKHIIIQRKRPKKVFSFKGLCKPEGLLLQKQRSRRKLKSTICQSFGAETPLLHSKLVVLQD